jgi:hypothetical protein
MARQQVMDMIGSIPIARPFRAKDIAELVPFLVSGRATSVYLSDNMVCDEVSLVAR